MKLKIVSADCLWQHHFACSGWRYNGRDKDGRPQYSRCGCACHKAKSE